MFFSVRAGSDLPIYRQIMRQVIDAIATGRLRGGDRIPSHRELSEQLVVAPLTVKKAYDELEAQGYIASQRGRGTFVNVQRPAAARKAQHSALLDAAKVLVAQGIAAGLDLEAIVQLVHDAAGLVPGLPPESGAAPAVRSTVDTRK
ncbi:GntR family transcriptional regulator [Gemmatimonas sp.]|jgi:GntR family transcriptional regulator|uniref:GntR family transcriptional regulator n=1 Tax=Gemmatimonas sp. TaxID=1962908 RepID=UPI0031BC421D|nr:GntR family transcriptional regulator [Gemmatimonas sp.]